MQSGKRQQGVVDGAKPAASGQNDGKFELHHHVQHELFGIDRYQTATAPSTTSQSFRRLGGNVMRFKSISTPAQRAARSGETGGTNLYISSSVRSVPMPARRITVTRSEPSRVPV